MPFSWEIASGPTVGYKMADQASPLVAVESPKGSAHSNFRVPDSMSRAFPSSGETSRRANYRAPLPHDTVMRGLSNLSLHRQYDADSVAEKGQSASICPVCCVSPELYRRMSPRNNESSSYAVAPDSIASKSLGQGSPACSMGFTRHNGLHGQDSSDEDGIDIFSHMDMPHSMALSTCYASSGNRGDQVFLENDSRAFYNHFWSPNVNIHEDEHSEDAGLDTISESSVSSENCMAVASSSSGENSQVLDDTEAESAYKEASELSCSVRASSHPRKGLSRFYTGKSRSFSCLRDIVSVKDLAKPESPYAKKRRVTLTSSGLPCLQKGPSTITKKPLQNGELALALAVAMSSKEENELQISAINSVGHKNLMPTRSFSLSELREQEGASFLLAESMMAICESGTVCHASFDAHL